MKINGKEYDFNNISVTDMLEKLELKALMLVVEVNGIIASKHMYDEMMLKKDDKIEIVSFVGGG